MNDCYDTHCSVCSDELIHAIVLQVHEEDSLALVEMQGRREEIDITLVGRVVPGQRLLVHGGAALAASDEEVSA